VPVAIHTATNAVQNNLIPAMIGVGLTAWEAYDLYKTATTQGIEAAVKQLGFDIVIATTGAYAGKRVYQLGKIVAPTALEALQAYKQAHPVFAKFYDQSASAIAKGVEKFKQFDAKLDAKLQQAWDKTKEKVIGKPASKQPEIIKGHDLECPVINDNKVAIRDTKELNNISTYQYNMMTNGGPLARMVDEPFLNFAGGRYNEFILKKDIILYRAGFSQHGYKGQWFSCEPPSSIPHARIDKAIKPHWIDPVTGKLEGSSPIDCYYAIKIPAGSTIYHGPVANQSGIYVGGSGVNQAQIFIPKGSVELEMVDKVIFK
jgi:hypothetical protein